MSLERERSVQYSEIFNSIEGEARYTGVPTAYVRFAKCNFTCTGFNNPEKLEITNEVLGFDPADYSDLNDLPVITRGCDSIYSWDNRFKHMWKKRTITQIAEELLNVIPCGSWIHPKTKQRTILSLTGGEPTLNQRIIPDLLNHALLSDVQIVLIETNCSIQLSIDFIDALNAWTDGAVGRKIVWSNSPKLSVSGEPWDKAIVPSVAAQQRLVKNSEQYFKFVCDESDESFAEVERAMEEYHTRGNIPEEDQQIYIMPVGALDYQQVSIEKQVAIKCLERGMVFCPRAHVHVFGNQVGT